MTATADRTADLPRVAVAGACTFDILAVQQQREAHVPGYGRASEVPNIIQVILGTILSVPDAHGR